LWATRCARNSFRAITSGAAQFLWLAGIRALYVIATGFLKQLPLKTDAELFDMLAYLSRRDQPRLVGGGSSAFAVDIGGPAWLSSDRLLPQIKHTRFTNHEL
jgi:hypothetical protein